MMMNLMTILVKKVFISSKPTFVYLLCPPLCGPFSIQESAAGGLSYKVKKEQGGKPRNGSLPPSSYFATSSESSRSTFDTSPHSFS